MVFSQNLPINKWKEGTISHQLNSNHLLIPLPLIYITRYLVGPNHTLQIKTSWQLNVLLKFTSSFENEACFFFSLWSRELWGICPTFNLESFQNNIFKNILAIPK
ncbi:hypothetical protein L345_00466, partial [Ophiophagus hannah]